VFIMANQRNENPGAVAADSPFARVKDGAQAGSLQAAYEAAQAGGGAATGGGGALRGDLAVSAQDAGSSPAYADSPAVRAYSADRLARQCNGGGSLNTGGRRR
jgi:hypothetical protein